MQALSVQNLKKVYKNGVLALREITFEVAAGDFFALLGPNGAGKSTLIGILSSLVRKTSGHVNILGHSIDKEFNAVKRIIGLVPQEFNFNIFHTVIQILENQAGYYGITRRQAMPRIELYLKKLGLWEKRNMPIRSLSGGMKRRLLIARGLVHAPKILILDEPTAGVDIELRRMLWDFLQELNNNGITVILTTHYLEEAEHLCRNIAIIDHGAIVACTAMSVLLQQLDTERFILYLDRTIESIPHLLGYQMWKINDNTLEVEVVKPHGLTQLFATLAEHQVNVISMRNKVSRLEELFIRLTSSRV